MSERFVAHTKILPVTQQRLLPELATAPYMGLVLYGGTAVALRLGHRQSVDFDFFTDEHLPPNKILRSAFPFLDRAVVLQDQPDTLTVSVSSSHEEPPVKVSFFGDIDFGRVGVPAIADSTGLEVASLMDLMATKLKAMLQRIEAKDYRDIAAMISAGVNLAEGLAAAKILFGNAFQPTESLKTLVYFEGGDLDTLSIMDRQILTAAAEGVRELPLAGLLSQRLSSRGLRSEELNETAGPDDTPGSSIL